MHSWDGSDFLFENTEQQADIPTLPLLSSWPSNVTPLLCRTIWKRGCPDAKEVRRLKDVNHNLKARLASAMQHIEAIGAKDSGRLSIRGALYPYLGDE